MENVTQAKSVKLLHCADLHLDSPMLFPGNTVAPMTKQDLRLCFEDICANAKSEGARIMLISGDLFNNTCCTPATVSFLCRIFGEYSDIKFFICTGNHDYYGRDSVYALKEFPENVHIFNSPVVQSVCLPDMGVCIHGIGCPTPHSSERLMRQDFDIQDDKINILMYHGNLVSGSTEDDYFPFTEEDAAATGMDYIALGHIHTYGGIKSAGSTFYAYPGIPQGRGFDELGDKGILIGEVGKHVCNLRFVPTCRKRFCCEEVDVTDCGGNDDIGKKALSAILGHDFVRIILKGEADFTVYVDEIAKYTESLPYVQIIDNTRAKLDPQVLATEKSLTGLFVKNIMESGIEDEDTVRQALKYGLAALRGEEIEL